MHEMYLLVSAIVLWKSEYLIHELRLRLQTLLQAGQRHCKELGSKLNLCAAG